MKLREILEELKKIKQIAWMNESNTFRDNNKKTKQAITDYLDKEWEEVK